MKLRTIAACLLCAVLLCVLLSSCQSQIVPGTEPETPEDGSEQTETIAAPSETDEKRAVEGIPFQSAFSSSHASYVTVPRNICYVAPYVIVARVTDYLGGIHLDSREGFSWRVGTLMTVENLENMKGNLILDTLPIVKAGGVYEEQTSGLLWDAEDYYPEIGTYWLFLLDSPKIGGLYIEIVGIYMFPLNVDPALEPEEALVEIHKDEIYLRYLDGVQNQEMPELLKQDENYDEEKLAEYKSVFEEDSEKVDQRSTFFIPDFPVENQAQILPHKQVDFSKFKS